VGARPVEPGGDGTVEGERDEAVREGEGLAFDRRWTDEGTGGGRLGREESVDLAAQVGIARASAVEVSGPFAGRSFERR
jgi:hypothetical protein